LIAGVEKLRAGGAKFLLEKRRFGFSLTDRVACLLDRAGGSLAALGENRVQRTADQEAIRHHKQQEQDNRRHRADKQSS